MTNTQTRSNAWQAARDTVSDGVRRINDITGKWSTRPAMQLEALNLIGTALAQGKREAARGLRSEGKSWADIAPLLGIELDPGDPGVSAFEFVAPGRKDFPLDPRTCSWSCDTCGKYISDSGPYNPHPSDQERGHTEDCTRHNKEITAYRKRRDED